MIWLDYGELDTLRTRYGARAAQPEPPRISVPGIADLKAADDLSGIGTPADLVDRVLNIIWTTFR
jgi:hypothetical protein